MKSPAAMGLGFLAAAMLVGGCGGSQTLTAGPAQGVLRAGRMGDSLIVEVGLAGVPPSVKVVTLGMQLADGTLVYPTIVQLPGGHTAEMAGLARCGFSFDGGAGSSAHADADALTERDRPGARTSTLWLKVTYRLHERDELVDGSMFAVVLGDPYASQAARTASNTTILVRDGSPSIFDGRMVAANGRGREVPLPPAPAMQMPVVAFRFGEPPGAGRDEHSTAIIPALAYAGNVVPRWMLRPPTAED